ncbi:Fic family protein [Desulfofundulus sp.]|uniref:Fic family protein n=1 Tax=Desulfofundulus sp. TaxID=2282750 RepID=UPI003C78DBB1
MAGIDGKSVIIVEKTGEINMPRKIPCWQPRYTITPAIARFLMEIEAAKAIVGHTPLPPWVENRLREKARVRASHYSTYIEGNRLTLEEAENVIRGKEPSIRGKEHDAWEVRNYWNALLRVEEWASQKVPLTEELIWKLHAVVMRGRRAKPTPYRDGQNVIRDAATGAIAYLPPEAKDVPVLMSEMIAWIRKAEKENLPVPLIAALVHYQFVTIHPFYDGNGRTARLLATFILHKGGYGLNGFFSLEEQHARDLGAYYRAIAVHPHHNYYMGRAEAELTPWLEYFLELMAKVFTEAKDEAVKLAEREMPVEPEQVRLLDRRARIVFGLFAAKKTIGTKDVAAALGLSERMARELLREWTEQGWLVLRNPSKKGRQYALAEDYRQFIGNLTAK